MIHAAEGVDVEAREARSTARSRWAASATNTVFIHGVAYCAPPPIA